MIPQEDLSRLELSRSDADNDAQILPQSQIADPAEFQAIRVNSPRASSPKTAVTSPKIYAGISIKDYQELSELMVGKIAKWSENFDFYDHASESRHYSPLKIFKVDFKEIQSVGDVEKNDGNDSEFKSLFNAVIDKIYYSDLSFDKQKLSTYLYAILAISVGENESIGSFFKCCDALIKNGSSLEIKDAIERDSWIKNPENYSKLMGIVKKIEKIHDDSLASKTLIFSEENLDDWLKNQIQDRRLKELKFLNNEEFIETLIDTCDQSQTSDISSKEKVLELKEIDKHLREFLQENVNFLDKLTKMASGSQEERRADLAKYLLDNLFEKMLSQNPDKITLDKNQKLQELRDNFAEKIQTFGEKLSDSKILKLDIDEHLIIELISKIPTKIDNILQAKNSAEENPFEANKKIRVIEKSLGMRDSIFEFREVCSDQARHYSKSIKKLEEFSEKTGASRC